MDTWVAVGIVVLVGAGFTPVADDVAISEANTSPIETEATTHHVHIDGFAMDPDPLEIAVGDTVVWHNHDSVSHTATEDDNAWGTGTIAPGGSASITFDEAASYGYFCAVHPGQMTGYELDVLAPNDPPTVAIDTPEEDDVLSGEATIAGTASDPDGDVEKVEVRVDDGEWRTAAGTEDWSLSWDTQQLADGQHTIEARSDDGQDTSPLAAVTVQTDNPHPDLAVTQLDAEAGLEATTITATVDNEGEAEASATALEIRYEADNAQGLVATEPVPELAVGASFEVTLDWDTTGKVGAFEVSAETDPDDTVLDFQPDNDERSQTVCVPGAEGVTCLVPGTDATG